MSDVIPEGRERCPGCIKLPHEVNHPPGMVFVGWGIGWDRCPICGGSGLKPVPPPICTGHLVHDEFTACPVHDTPPEVVYLRDLSGSGMVATMPVSASPPESLSLIAPIVKWAELYGIPVSAKAWNALRETLGSVSGQRGDASSDCAHDWCCIENDDQAEQSLVKCKACGIEQLHMTPDRKTNGELNCGCPYHFYHLKTCRFIHGEPPLHPCSHEVLKLGCICVACGADLKKVAPITYDDECDECRGTAYPDNERITLCRAHWTKPR